MSTSEKKPLVITPEQAQSIYKKLRIAQSLFVVCYATILILFTLLNITLADGGFKLWLVQCVPLLIFIPGLLQERYRTYSWICFAILPYFAWSVVNVMSPFIRWHDIVVVVLTVIIFNASMMASRWLQYWQYYNRQHSQPLDLNV